jgi:hypothetical protein
MPGSAWSYVERMIWSHSSRARTVPDRRRAGSASARVLRRLGLVHQLERRIRLTARMNSSVAAETLVVSSPWS